MLSLCLRVFVRDRFNGLSRYRTEYIRLILYVKEAGMIEVDSVNILSSYEMVLVFNLD